jgi:hypothetical protein
LRNTIILVAVAIALVLFIAVFESSTPSTTELKVRQRLAYPDFKGKSGHADAIEVIRGPNKIVLVKRDVGTAEEHWQITQPIDYPADTSRVIAMLGAFERAERSELSQGTYARPLSPTDNMEEYGLTLATAIRVVASYGDEKLLDAYVGGETASKGKIYAAPADRSEVFVVAEEVRSNATVHLGELRDKRMLSLGRGRITHITLLENEQPAVELTRGPENDWRLTAPVSDRADPGKVEKIVDRAGALWAEGFKVDFPQDDQKMIDKLREFGLKPAVRSVRVTRTIADVPVHHEILFGNRVRKTEGQKTSWSVYAMVAGSRSVVYLPETALAPFKLRADTIRDRRALAFEVSEATAVSFTQDTGDLRLERREGGWKMRKPEEHDADEGAVRALLTGLAELRAETFLPFGTELTAPAKIEVTTSADGKETTESLFVELRPDERLRARRGEAGAVIEIASGPLASLKRPHVHLWSRRILSFDADRLSMLATTIDGKRTVAKRADSVWTLDGGGEVVVRTADTIKWELTDLTASAYVGHAAKAKLESYGLTKPAVKVEIELKATGTEAAARHELWIGTIEDEAADEKRHYAKLAGGDVVFLLPATSVEKLQRPLDAGSVNDK